MAHHLPAQSDYKLQHELGGSRIITRAEGCVITEFPPGAPPCGWHFPQRNRLIGALALGVLVVEATVESGTMSTVRQALRRSPKRRSTKPF